MSKLRGYHSVQFVCFRGYERFVSACEDGYEPNETSYEDVPLFQEFCGVVGQ